MLYCFCYQSLSSKPDKVICLLFTSNRIILKIESFFVFPGVEINVPWAVCVCVCVLSKLNWNIANLLKPTDLCECEWKWLWLVNFGRKQIWLSFISSKSFYNYSIQYKLFRWSEAFRFSPQAPVFFFSKKQHYILNFWKLLSKKKLKLQKHTISINFDSNHFSSVWISCWSTNSLLEAFSSFYFLHVFI